MIPEFLTPTRLLALLLLPALIIAYLIAIRVREKRGVRFTNTAVLGVVIPKQGMWVRHLAVAMALCSLGALTLAWAQPIGIQQVPRERATVVLVIDTSQSMAATDVKPSRIAAAKSAAIDFTRKLPPSFNVSVVSLCGSPSMRVPPTTDRGMTERVISGLSLCDGTAIGEALKVALDAVKQAPKGDEKARVPAMIVLLSDGANTVGAGPTEWTRVAATEKIPIYTIAYGTLNGYVDLDGVREPVPPDRALMKEVAQHTKGESFEANSVDRLYDAYKTIGSSIGYESVRKPVTAEYAFGALGFAIIAALGAIMMAAKWPR